MKDQLLNLFILGYVTLRERALGDSIYIGIARKVDSMTKNLEYVPDDLEKLQKRMFDTYYCNFSLFQSVPDHWAVGALFPIVPIQDLDKEPTRRAILADLTCDSDGKISKFIDLHDVKPTLPLHKFDGGPYYVGVFVVGAYQETLGDLHNLFGDTDAVHVSLDGNGNYNIHDHVMGDTVADVLGYMEYDTKKLVSRVRMATEAALKAGRMTFEEVRLLMKRYETGLAGYTYLEGEDELIEAQPAPKLPTVQQVAAAAVQAATATLPQGVNGHGNGNGGANGNGGHSAQVPPAPQPATSA